MSDDFADGVFRGLLVGAMLGSLAVAACGFGGNAHAQALERHEERMVPVPGTSYLAPAIEPDAGLSMYLDTDYDYSKWAVSCDGQRAILAPDTIVAYCIGTKWIQAGRSQCVP